MSGSSGEQAKRHCGRRRAARRAVPRVVGLGRVRGARQRREGGRGERKGEKGKREKERKKKKKRKERRKREREGERAPAAIAAPVGHAQRSRARADEATWKGVGGLEIRLLEQGKTPAIRV